MTTLPKRIKAAALAIVLLVAATAICDVWRVQSLQRRTLSPAQIGVRCYTDWEWLSSFWRNDPLRQDACGNVEYEAAYVIQGRLGKPHFGLLFTPANNTKSLGSNCLSLLFHIDSRVITHISHFLMGSYSTHRTAQKTVQTLTPQEVQNITGDAKELMYFQAPVVYADVLRAMQQVGLRSNEEHSRTIGSNTAAIVVIRTARMLLVSAQIEKRFIDQAHNQWLLAATGKDCQRRNAYYASGKAMIRGYNEIQPTDTYVDNNIGDRQEKHWDVLHVDFYASCSVQKKIIGSFLCAFRVYLPHDETFHQKAMWLVFGAPALLFNLGLLFDYGPDGIIVVELFAGAGMCILYPPLLRWPFLILPRLEEIYNVPGLGFRVLFGWAVMVGAFTIVSYWGRPRDKVADKLEGKHE